MTLGLARMFALGGVIFQSANLLTGRTIALMAVMGIRVVTLRGNTARQPTLDGADFLFASTWNFESRSGTSEKFQLLLYPILVFRCKV